MQRIPSDRARVPLFEDGYVHPRHAPLVENTELTEWLSPSKPQRARNLDQLEQQAEHIFEDLGIRPGVGDQFFKYVPPRLAKLRLQVSSLAKAQGVAKQQVCLAGLSMQCQWLAGYARMANFYAVAQVASAVEALTRGLYDRPDFLNEGTLRTIGQAVDLLNALASSPPTKSGRAEGARVLIVDDDVSSRAGTLAALERFDMNAITVAGSDTVVGLLMENTVDVIIIRAGSSATATPQLCQAIRRVPRQGTTPVLVLSPQSQWENRAVLAMSGASEVIPGSLLEAELALKVLAHFFRGRLSGL